MVKDEDSFGTSVLFEDLFDLWIVDRLDLVLVDKVFLDAGMVDELEPADVEAQTVALSSSVMDDYRARVLADVGLCDACRGGVDVVVRRLGIERSIIVEGRLDVAGSKYLDGHCQCDYWWGLPSTWRVFIDD